MYKLVISDDEGKNTVVPLVRDEITIGRKEGNTIRLTERNVSRRHARLVKANGRFVIEDLHSYNGVRLNGQRIGGETPLDAGDQIQIGDYHIALQVDGTDSVGTIPEQRSPHLADADTAMIAAPGPPARLVMITPPAPGAEFALTGERCRIGRAEDLDVWVNHRSISREHAEVQKVADGGLRLIDLGSANGVRVNGKDVQNALLEAGDVVELGQVRFRFVAAGEHYAFDADRTVQMDAVTLEGPPTNKLPIVAIVMILAVALAIGGGIVLLGGESEEPVVRPLPPDPIEAQAADARGYEEALAACRAAIGRLDLANAMIEADAALRERPGDSDATACRAQATAMQPDARMFEAGLAHLQEGDYQAAYFDFENLGEESVYRAQPQVVQAVQGYANAQIATANARLHTAPEEALQLAEFVLNMRDITQSQRSTAETIRTAVLGRVDASAQAAAPRGPRGASPGRRNPQTPPRAREEQRQVSPPEPRETPTRAAGGGGPSLDEQARECTMSGDNACVIRLLENRARTAQQIGMLIEAYRARGQTQQALRHMRTYVQRFGSTPRGRQYQQILNRH